MQNNEIIILLIVIILIIALCIHAAGANKVILKEHTHDGFLDDFELEEIEREERQQARLEQRRAARLAEDRWVREIEQEKQDRRAARIEHHQTRNILRAAAEKRKARRTYPVWISKKNGGSGGERSHKALSDSSL